MGEVPLDVSARLVLEVWVFISGSLWSAIMRKEGGWGDTALLCMRMTLDCNVFL